MTGAVVALVAFVVLAAAVTATALIARPNSGGAPNPIVTENARAGTPGWNQSLGQTAPATEIDGYASASSVTPGAPLQFHITGAAGVRYRLEVYRLGWYQGIGARLQECVPSCTTDEPVAPRPPTPAPDPTSGYLDAGWPVTDTVTLPGTAVSGVYLAKIVVTAGSASAGLSRNISFVVREAVPRSPMLVQIGVNTQQAYNDWGGKSLYAYNSTGGNAATEVSFNRPDAFAGTWVMQWDYPLIEFLERQGYDVSYATDVDTAQGVDAPGARRLVIVAGHGEYWSTEMRDALDAAQALRTNMAFMGANTGYWQMRYGNAYRAIYEYRSAQADPNPNPATKTTYFRSLQPPRPECRLEGAQDTGGISVGPPPHPDYQIASGALSDRWFTGTGLTASSLFPGIVGAEWDTADRPGCPAARVLLTWSGANRYGQPSEADAATFTVPSGARVFAAGSLQFAWGLDDITHPTLANPGLQRFMQNVLDDLSTNVPPPPKLPQTRVLVAARCTSASYKPKRIQLSCARYARSMQKLKWRSWTQTKAIGTGVLTISSCRQACHARHVKRYAVKVTLSRPGVCQGQSHKIFKQMNLAFRTRRAGRGRPKHLRLSCPA
ncbi:MAG: hypothetical protein M3Z06_06230 [Actinomycetota bacterium]|nr:hypothetical protein [Actinomycetota bacterium]